MFKKLLPVLFVCLLFATETFALSFSRRAELVGLKIIPEYTAVSPETATLDIIAEADISRGWHLYWDNPGDIGEPAVLTFFESPYYQETSATRTAPEKSVFGDIITSYIYKDKVYFHTSFALKNLSGLNRLPFELVFSYTACRESCQPEDIRLAFALPVAATAEKNPDYAKAVPSAEPTFPVPLSASYSPLSRQVELKLQDEILQNCANAEFVSRHRKKSPLSPLPETSVTADGRLYVNFAEGELPPDMDGILLCPGHAYYLKPSLTAETTARPPHTDAPLPPAPAPAQNNTGLLYYMLTAFIAGLILNLMPCVLPILSIKALSLLQNRRHASPFSAFSYVAGVVSSFLLLAGILFALREAGAGMGWGFQLQSPLFNIFLLLLFFLIFLNLIDRLPLPDTFADRLSRAAGQKSFLTGFFAVLIACPCTGPFMGAALGYAIARSAEIYFGIFLALGLGYALPYALIELFPSFFLKYIPKPGHWMITLKRVLALPILLTCLWLGWIICGQLRPAPAATELTWETYTPAKAAAAIAEGQPVFINFTAKWCLVCLLNDKSSLSSAAFQDIVRRRNIRLLKADWTNRDESIRHALQTYKRNSIPLYVYYPAGSNTPQILPQLLTPDILQDRLETPTASAMPDNPPAAGLP